MKYIRTNDTIYDTARSNIKYDNDYVYEYLEGPFRCIYESKHKIIAQADTIEELMMIDDLVFKKNGDIFIIANQAHIDYYIKHKSISKLFIEDSKGNYIKVAEENEQGELELL